MSMLSTSLSPDPVLGTELAMMVAPMFEVRAGQSGTEPRFQLSQEGPCGGALGLAYMWNLEMVMEFRVFPEMAQQQQLFLDEICVYRSLSVISHQKHILFCIVSCQLDTK